MLSFMSETNCSSGVCTRPSVLKGMCRACYQRWRYENVPGVREKTSEARRKWRASNLARDRAYNTAYNRSRQRERSGFSVELVAQVRRAQGGQCALCSVRLRSGKRADAECCDHDHITGLARGLLCSICNKGLGGYEKHQRLAGLVIQPYEDYLENPPVSRL
jgi:hypothetical protein